MAQFKNRGMYVLCLATLMCSFATSSVNVALPELVVSLKTDFLRVQWILITFLLAITFTLVVAGRLSDLYGRKRLFLMGVFVFTCSSGMAGFANSLELMVGLRLVQGIGAGMLLAISMAIASDITPKVKLGQSIGLLGSMSAIGTGLGPVIGGAWVDSYGWPSIFLVNIPIGLIIYSQAFKCLPTDALKPQQGIFICMPGVLSRITNWAIPLGLLSSFIVSTVVMTSLVIGPFYLVNTLGLSTTRSGLVMGISPAIVALVSFLVGQISEHLDLRVLVLAGLLMLMAGTLGMANLKVEFGVTGYVLCLTGTAVGYATFLSSNNTRTMAQATSLNRGAVSGLLNLARNSGLLTGVALMSNLFASRSQVIDFSTARPAMVEAGVHAAYTLGSVLLLLLIAIHVMVLLINKLRKK